MIVIPTKKADTFQQKAIKFFIENKKTLLVLLALVIVGFLAFRIGAQSVETVETNTNETENTSNSNTTSSNRLITFFGALEEVTDTQISIKTSDGKLNVLEFTDKSQVIVRKDTSRVEFSELTAGKQNVVGYARNINGKLVLERVRIR